MRLTNRKLHPWAQHDSGRGCASTPVILISPTCPSGHEVGIEPKTRQKTAAFDVLNCLCNGGLYHCHEIAERTDIRVDDGHIDVDQS